MKIGITVEGNCINGIEKICNHIQVIGCNENTSELFREIIKENLKNELYMERVLDLGLTLKELEQGFRLLAKNNKIIIFLDKGALYYLSDQQYFYFINEMVKNEIAHY